MDNYNVITYSSIAITVLFSIAAGLVLAFVFTLIRPVILSRILSAITLIFLYLVFCVEHDCLHFYKMYYGITYAISVTGQVMGDFSDVVWEVAGEYALQEALLFLPLLVYFVFMGKILPKKKYTPKLIPVILIPFLIIQLSADLVCRNSDFSNFYTYDFTTFSLVPHTGIINTFGLEITYSIFGTPKAPIEDDKFVLWTPEDENLFTDNTDSPNSPDNEKSASDNNSDINEKTGTNNSDETDTVEKVEIIKEPVIYDYNAYVDFASLIENENNQTTKKMHEYFGSLEPTMQNEYTGYFEGKNLIFMSVEAFSPYAIDKDFTPTLYKLANEGFVFENFYQPSWSLSTTGGEFANMTGVIPEWIESGNSFTVSEDKYMPYSIGNLLKNEGYSCKAFHNSTYDFYERDKTHPNLGYDYKGIGNGLKVDLTYWPASDLEMMEVTLPEIITESKETGVPFHAYYMTVSGHCNYSWGANYMSKKNKDAAVEAYPDSSTTVQAYMACNLEFENACKFILEELEKEGILEDTVICFTADHYPYAMSEGNVDYYKELSGIDDTTRSISRYKNALILYCASMKEPVIVDTPCYSVDIVPTLDNLFNVKYDSRLYSGRDIFATNYEADKVSSTMPLVIVPVGNKYSFVTAAGEYDSYTKEFKPNPGINVDEDEYVKEVQSMIQNKWTYAKLIITNDYYRKVLTEKED
ncbi:MAG: LTA synthase family protein [Lachnospiraceae bacterium]|nr:LTA synthase family protein [Lachnospiraceae bacterium]